MKAIISALLFFFLLSCTTSEDKVDSKLLGTWYSVTTSSHYPSNTPVKIFRGWNITKDGKMNPIGVEAATGTIALIDTKYGSEIEFANSGKMSVKHYAHPNLVTDEVSYSVTNNTLSLEGDFIKGTFERTRLSEKVMNRIPADLDVSIDGERAENIKVSNRVPTAYISKNSSSDIEIKATMNWKKILITIDDFSGPGTYIIGKEQAAFSRFGTDWIEPDNTTDADSSGFITITECTPNGTRCTGEFEFSTNMNASQENPNYPLQHLTNGSFDLPVYQ